MRRVRVAYGHMRLTLVPNWNAIRVVAELSASIRAARVSQDISVPPKAVVISERLTHLNNIPETATKQYSKGEYACHSTMGSYQIHNSWKFHY